MAQKIKKIEQKNMPLTRPTYSLISKLSKNRFLKFFSSIKDMAMDENYGRYRYLTMVLTILR